MFRITKDHVELEVHLNGNRVKLEPHALYPSIAKTVLAIVQSEELLANHYLHQNTIKDPVELLKSYFQHRGWHLVA